MSVFKLKGVTRPILRKAELLNRLLLAGGTYKFEVERKKDISQEEKNEAATLVVNEIVMDLSEGRSVGRLLTEAIIYIHENPTNVLGIQMKIEYVWENVQELNKKELRRLSEDFA